MRLGEVDPIAIGRSRIAYVACHVDLLYLQKLNAAEPRKLQACHREQGASSAPLPDPFLRSDVPFSSACEE